MEIKRQSAVKITLRGLSLEKLIQLAGENDIPLWHLKRKGAKTVTALVNKGDFLRLAPLCEARGWEMTKNGEVRLAALQSRLHRRPGILFGAVALVMVMVVALQFVWGIELVDAGAYAGDIRAVLSEMGIAPGIPKNKINVAELNRALEYRYPSTAFVKVAFRGANLSIRIIEGVPVPEVVTRGAPNDIVAERAGIIVSMEPYQGTPMVKIGDLVKKGQVLIRGEELHRPVKARGRVLAKVWLRAVVRLPAFTVASTPTGRSESEEVIETPFGSLFEKEDTAFVVFDTQIERLPVIGAFFPITFKRVTRFEVTTDLKAREIEEVKQEAREAADNILREKIAADDDLIDKWVDYCMIEGREMEAAAVAQVVRNIATAPER